MAAAVQISAVDGQTCTPSAAIIGTAIAIVITVRVAAQTICVYTNDLQVRSVARKNSIR